MINPGKGLPLFPSEQFWSLQVMYCDPVGKQEMSTKNITTEKQTAFCSPQSRFSIAYADGIKWAIEAKFWRPIIILTNG